MADDIKNVFISHIHEDDEGLGKLKDLLKSKGMTIRDYSVNSDNPNNAKSEDYIKSKILAPRIDASSVLVVYISPDCKDSDYVDWEIAYAESQNKRIVGVWAWGDAGCDIPKSLDDHYDAIVGWNGDRIIDAIEGRFDGYEAPDQTPRDRRPIRRHPC
jgi:hypothetical protein